MILHCKIQLKCFHIGYGGLYANAKYFQTFIWNFISYFICKYTCNSEIKLLYCDRFTSNKETLVLAIVNPNSSKLLSVIFLLIE